MFFLSADLIFVSCRLRVAWRLIHCVKYRAVLSIGVIHYGSILYFVVNKNTLVAEMHVRCNCISKFMIFGYIVFFREIFVLIVASVKNNT